MLLTLLFLFLATNSALASVPEQINSLPVLDALNRSESPLSNGGKWSALNWATKSSNHATGQDTTAGWGPYDAYSFAAAFTLPPDEINTNVDADLTLRRARDLKRSYWISMQAVIRAARDRDLISMHRYRSLCKQISARGWRLEEPDPLDVERPSVWANALGVHRHMHGYGDEDLASIAKLTAADLAALFPRDFPPCFRVIQGDRTSSVGLRQWSGSGRRAPV